METARPLGRDEGQNGSRNTCVLGDRSSCGSVSCTHLPPPFVRLRDSTRIGRAANGSIDLCFQFGSRCRLVTRARTCFVNLFTNFEPTRAFVRAPPSRLPVHPIHLPSHAHVVSSESCRWGARHAAPSAIHASRSSDVGTIALGLQSDVPDFSDQLPIVDDMNPCFAIYFNDLVHGFSYELLRNVDSMLPLDVGLIKSNLFLIELD